MRTGTTEHWYYFDGLGSVLGLIDSTGTVKATYAYDPYGVTTNTTPYNGTDNSTVGNNNPYRYAGGYQDTATGLYKYGARYYQPTLGRWTQQDTLDSIGDPANGNRYAYAGDDPINQVDPSGASVLGDVAGVVGSLVVGAIGYSACGPVCAAAGGGFGFGFFHSLGDQASEEDDGSGSNHGGGTDYGAALKDGLVGGAAGLFGGLLFT